MRDDDHVFGQRVPLLSFRIDGGQRADARSAARMAYWPDVDLVTCEFGVSGKVTAVPIARVLEMQLDMERAP
jgi:hypothetical protein